MIKIDCKKYADEIIEKVSQIPNKKKLVILTAGDNPASASYMKGKMKDCERCGVPCEQIRVVTEQELLNMIHLMNWNDDVGGIIVQLPLPEGWDEDFAVNSVRIEKDVDGFRKDSKFLPCTPEGILYILEKELGDLTGKSALLIGKGKLIGRPMMELLLDRGCTLTIAHSRTESLETLLGQYHDIVITGVGKPYLIDLFEINARVVIDAGVNRDKFGKLCGDCYNFTYFLPDMKVTPVPNGIGLMTRAMLMKHMGEV
jgi:methylenetetrahydrofolate dehydrogenase (NADP+)/methenyltetrahydrofolate cyclohydrolase